MAAKGPMIYICSTIKNLGQSLLNKRPDINIRIVPVAKSEFEKDAGLPPGTVETLKEAEVIVGEPQLLGPVMYSLPKLKWMSLTWAGIDAMLPHVDHSKPAPSYKLTRFGGGFGEHMAEYVIGHIIANERHFFRIYEDNKKKEWAHDSVAEYRILPQLILGILGMGDIGKDVAKAAKALGMQVWGMTRRPMSDDRRSPHVDKYIQTENMADLLKSCDYLCNILPSTPSTRGLLSGDVLSHCKNKKAVFINVGRGDVIDDKSLLKAVREGWLDKAVLDVQSEEPVPPDSPLWEQPSIYISPHVSAVSFADQFVDLFVENYDRYICGKKLKYEANIMDGY